MIPSIKPTPQTLQCQRVQNENFSRLEYMRLDKNEKTVGYPEELIREMLESITPTMISSYPEPFRLHKKLAHFLGVAEDRLLLTSGSDAAIKTCFETFIDSGHKLIRLDPTYAMVGVYSKLFGAEEKTLSFDKELKLDYEDLIKIIRSGAKLLYIANPNSPTGTILDIDQLREVCKEAKKSNTVALIDEAYYYFSSVTAFNLLDDFDNLIIVRTFSKAIGLSSVRLGYLIASKKVMNWLSRWRPMYEINTIAQHCGCFILDHWDYVERYAKEVIKTREWFIGEIKKMGLESFPSNANFVLVKYPKENIPAAVKQFEKNGILIRGGGNNFPFSGMLRFSLGVPFQMKECLQILDELGDK